MQFRVVHNCISIQHEPKELSYGKSYVNAAEMYTYFDHEIRS